MLSLIVPTVHCHLTVEQYDSLRIHDLSSGYGKATESGTDTQLTTR